LAAFAAILVMMGVVGGIGTVSLATVSGLMSNMYSDALIPTINLGKADTSLYQMKSAVAEFLLADDQQKKDAARVKISDGEKALVASVDGFRGTSLSATERDLLAQFDAVWPDYVDDLRCLLVGLDACRGFPAAL
jgi:hypothetical protein